MSRYVIDKKKLEENIRLVKEKAKTDVIGVVKGNGYGFGLTEFARYHNLCCYRVRRYPPTEKRS